MEFIKIDISLIFFFFSLFSEKYGSFSGKEKTGTSEGGDLQGKWDNLGFHFLLLK
jgi:hypothetical protein